MGRVFKLDIAETVEYLSVLHKEENHPKVKQRLHMLYLWKANIATRFQKLCEQLNKSPAQVKRWAKCYRDNGIEELLQPPIHPGRTSSLTPAVEAALSQKLKGAHFTSFRDIHQWLVDEYAVSIGYHAVWHLVRQMGAKLKTARPYAEEHDVGHVVEFKKNSVQH